MKRYAYLAPEQLMGVISIGDVVKAIISEHESVIKQLENYIAEGR